jgi:molybdopterin biosynthesis enzyme MoaB
MIKVAIIIASNTRSKEINKDETIPLLIDFANANNWEVVDSSIAAGEIKELSDKMILCRFSQSRPCTCERRYWTVETLCYPEAMRLIIEKEILGISEVMGAKNLRLKKSLSFCEV